MGRVGARQDHCHHQLQLERAEHEQRPDGDRWARPASQALGGQTDQSSGALERALWPRHEWVFVDTRHFKWHSLTRNQVELPEDFFNVTKEDLDREMRARTERKRQEEQDKSHLKTREMREMERVQRLKKWNKTMIRIRFPDRVELQANFLPNERTYVKLTLKHFVLQH